MRYEIYRYIFFGGAILAGVMLIVSVLVFFLLKIPQVISDLSGSKARKTIKMLRRYNESTGDKVYRSSTVNMERGKLTDKISHSGRIVREPSDSLKGSMGTEKIGSEIETSNETALLSENQLQINDSVDATTLLSENDTVTEFTVECEITLVQSNEVIES